MTNADITLIGNAIDKPAEYGKIKVLRLATNNGKDDKKPAYWDIKILAPWLCEAAASIEKGERLIIVGYMHGTEYQTKDGQTRHGMEVIANTIGRVLQTPTTTTTPAWNYAPDVPQF